ncbi:Dynein light chain [Xylographa bjoerkii]|nr:Dynein light chain [Xylographa bjoerkii]
MATEKEKKKLDAQIKSADMSEDMQQEAIEVATEAMDKFNIEKVQKIAEKDAQDLWLIALA